MVIAFILVHNHPSGSLDPSQDDVAFTRAMSRAGELMGINLYDHPKMVLAFLRSERDVDCAGHVPPLGDTGPDTSVIPPERRPAFNSYAHRRLEYLAARAGDPVVGKLSVLPTSQDQASAAQQHGCGPRVAKPSVTHRYSPDKRR